MPLFHPDPSFSPATPLRGRVRQDSRTAPPFFWFLHFSLFRREAGKQATLSDRQKKKIVMRCAFFRAFVLSFLFLSSTSTSTSSDTTTTRPFIGTRERLFVLLLPVLISTDTDSAWFFVRFLYHFLFDCCSLLSLPLSYDPPPSDKLILCLSLCVCVCVLFSAFNRDFVVVKRSVVGNGTQERRAS